FMRTWLVTGGSGFLGRHLLGALGEGTPEGVRVLAMGRRPPVGGPAGGFVRADLEDRQGLARLVGSMRPEVVFHLAGQTPPSDPARLYRVNVGGTVGLLGALRDAGRPVRVVLAGSAAELGPVPVEDLPVGEGQRCRPMDPYALSKWFATYAGRTA